MENLNTVGENFIEFTKVIAAKAVQLDDIIDLALEPVKDYTDTLGDLAGPVKSLISIYNLKRKLSFRAFLINYSYQINNGYEINEKETKKLVSLFRNERNINYVSEIIDGAVNAKSLISSALLGVIAGKFIKNKPDITYRDLSIIESLKILTDFDIENFVVLYEYLETINTAHEDTKEYRTQDFYNKENKCTPKVERESIEFTIEKLKRTNGLTYNSGGIGQAGNSRGSFETSDISQELYFMIKETHILN